MKSIDCWWSDRRNPIVFGPETSWDCPRTYVLGSPLFDDFDQYYRNTKIDNSSVKIEYNINFLSKLINYFKKIDIQSIANEINGFINFNRQFEKWDTINQSIILVAISELRNSEKEKMIIIMNDYLDLSKSFVSLKETKLINSILDKLIND